MYESRVTLCVYVHSCVCRCVLAHTCVAVRGHSPSELFSLLGISGIQVRWSGLQAPLPAVPSGVCQLLLKVENLFLLCMIFRFLFPKQSMLLNGLWPETAFIANSLQKSDTSKFKIPCIFW